MQAQIDKEIDRDINVLYGYGEHGDAYWALRYETVFSRMAALGLRLVGPQASNGRRASPWPDELPRTGNNVPTYHAKKQSPATCTRQLDFVFATGRLAEGLRITALNEPDHWGPRFAGSPISPERLVWIGADAVPTLLLLR